MNAARRVGMLCIGTAALFSVVMPSAGAASQRAGRYVGTFSQRSSLPNRTVSYPNTEATVTCSSTRCTVAFALPGIVTGVVANGSGDHFVGKSAPEPVNKVQGVCDEPGRLVRAADLRWVGTTLHLTLTGTTGSWQCDGSAPNAGSHWLRTAPITITYVANPVGGAPTTTPGTPGATSEPAGRQRTSSAPTGGLTAAMKAVRAGRRSTVPASLQTPSEAFKNARNTAENVALAALLVLLLVFPSELFNSTFDKHHERIEAAWRKRFHRRPKTDRTAPPARRAVTYLAVVAAGAVLSGFLDPHFGLHVASLALVVGVVISTLFAATLGGLTQREYRRLRRLATGATVVAVPAGLLIAFFGVVVSRSVHFQPGYLYGLVGGLSFAVALERRDDGRERFAGFAVGLTAAVIGWMVFIPVSHAANQPHPSFGTLVADSVFAAIFIGGIEGTLFSLTPLQFLPGHHIVRWSRTAWAILTFATAFLFVEVLLRPQSGYLGRSSTASALVTYGLFGLFGAASVAFWSWFRFHPDATRSVVDAPLAD